MMLSTTFFKLNQGFHPVHIDKVSHHVMVIQDLMVGERIGETERQFHFLVHMDTRREDDVLVIATMVNLYSVPILQTILTKMMINVHWLRFLVGMGAILLN